jgi:hypothetical protein
LSDHLPKRSKLPPLRRSQADELKSGKDALEADLDSLPANNDGSDDFGPDSAETELGSEVFMPVPDEGVPAPPVSERMLLGGNIPAVSVAPPTSDAFRSLPAPEPEPEPRAKPTPSKPPPQAKRAAALPLSLLLLGGTLAGIAYLAVTRPPWLGLSPPEAALDQRGAEVLSASHTEMAEPATESEREAPPSDDVEPATAELEAPIEPPATAKLQGQPPASNSNGSPSGSLGSTQAGSDPTATATGTSAAPSKEEPSEAPAEKADGPPPASSAAVAPSEAPAGAPFSTQAAADSLSGAAGRAAACRKEGDPSGLAQVSVTFANSGRATRAIIEGPPFAGTATGSCIAAILRTASVPPFGGDRVTVTKKVVIQ